MAIAAATVFEVRTGGADTNGGGFVTGATGSDFSQQSAAQYSGANLASTNGTTNPSVVTSATHNFVATDVGNLIHITAGTSWTVGFYQIVSVAANAATLDRAVGSAASLSAGTFAVGGALASPGMGASGMVAGNTMWIAAGTYTITSASTNVAGGCLSIPASGSTTRCRVIGYQTVRGDGGTKPLLQAGAITTFTIVSTVSSCWVENIEVDGVSKTSSRGFTGTTSVCYRCKANNCTNSGFGSAGFAALCEATGCTTQPAFSATSCHACSAYSNTGVAGYSSCVSCSYCIASNNSGAAGIGFLLGVTSQAINCTAYGNGSDGFRLGSSGSPICINCLAVNNSGWGLEANSGTYDPSQIINCAAFNNTSGAFNLPNVPQNERNVTTLTADPFTNGAGNDFSLNTTAGGGASCRAGGSPASFPGLSTNNFMDIGAAQHADPAGGGGGMLVHPGMSGGMRG